MRNTDYAADVGTLDSARWVAGLMAESRIPTESSLSGDTAIERRAVASFSTLSVPLCGPVDAQAGVEGKILAGRKSVAAGLVGIGALAATLRSRLSIDRY